MTTPTTECRPQSSTEQTTQYLTVKEAAKMLGTTIWAIYKLISIDADFPAHNIGAKKKWVVNESDLKIWMEKRKHRQILQRQGLPTANELLKLKGS